MHSESEKLNVELQFAFYGQNELFPKDFFFALAGGMQNTFTNAEKIRW